MATKTDPSQFQPDKSSSSTDAIKDWCMKPDISSSESMTVIPGVGPATAAAFSKVNIQKTKLSLTVFFVLVLIRPTNLLYQFSHFLCATPLLSLSLFVHFFQGGIDTIAQLLGKFLSFVDGESDTMGVCQAFFSWAKATCKENGAAKANMHSVTFAMANFATEKGLFEYCLE